MAFAFAVESWAPEYGAPMEPENAPDRPPPEVDISVELEPGDWRPLTPLSATAAHVAFVDGVQRVDARIWITNADGSANQGICASYAAGVVRCNGNARVEDSRPGRVVCAPGVLEGIQLPGAWGSYAPAAPKGRTVRHLVDALEARRRDLEVELSNNAAPADLVVLDGSLYGRQHVANAIGYLKSHEVAYLAGAEAAVIGQLECGQRTPVFLTNDNWSRYSWYLRLPCAREHPWAGVVRCESGHGFGVREAIRLADLSAATLPQYASDPHKDPRAPQNLYPIAGLERELRRHLGDQLLLYRALRLASTSPPRANGEQPAGD